MNGSNDRASQVRHAASLLRARGRRRPFPGRWTRAFLAFGRSFSLPSRVPTIMDALGRSHADRARSQPLLLGLVAAVRRRRHPVLRVHVLGAVHGRSDPLTDPGVPDLATSALRLRQRTAACPGAGRLVRGRTDRAGPARQGRRPLRGRGSAPPAPARSAAALARRGARPTMPELLGAAGADERASGLGPLPLAASGPGPARDTAPAAGVRPARPPRAHDRHAPDRDGDPARHGSGGPLRQGEHRGRAGLRRFRRWHGQGG